jgi:hypothetical protein
MADISVKPVRKGMNLSHPVAGALPDQPDENGNWPLWPEDQFTFRRLRDGDIKRVEADEVEPAKAADAKIDAGAPSNKRS